MPRTVLPSPRTLSACTRSLERTVWLPGSDPRWRRSAAVSTKNVPAASLSRDATCFCAVCPIHTWSGCAAMGYAGSTNRQPTAVPSGLPRV